MKKHIAAKYKLLALIPLMMMTGCGHESGKNIVKSVTTVSYPSGGCTKMVLLQDIKTGVERIYETTTYDFGYLKYGDTVTVYTYWPNTHKLYDEKRVLAPNDFNVIFNQDTISERKKRERYAVECKKFEEKRQEMLNAQQSEKVR